MNRVSSYHLFIIKKNMRQEKERNMNKAELVTAMAEKSELTKKDVEKALKAFQEVVTKGLISGEKISMVGFGNYDITERAERMGRNPQTSEPMLIKASKSVRFKAGKALKDAVNGR